MCFKYLAENNTTTLNNEIRFVKIYDRHLKKK